MSAQRSAERVKSFLTGFLALPVAVPIRSLMRIALGPKLDGSGKLAPSVLAFLLTGLWLAAILPAAMGVFLAGPFGQSRPAHHYPARCAADAAAWRDKFEHPQSFSDTLPPLPWHDPHSPACKQEIAAEAAAWQAKRAPQTAGDRVDAALAFSLLAGSFGGVAAYRIWRRGKAGWPGSIMEKASRWSLAASAFLLSVAGSSMLPCALGLNPHEPLYYIVLVCDLVAAVAFVFRDNIVSFFRRRAERRQDLCPKHFGYQRSQYGDWIADASEE